MKQAKQGQVIFIALLGIALFFAVFISLFIWYAKTVIPHTYPTAYTNFWWGLVHALFILPTFVWSLFAHTITIYQSPNDGGWYNFGYLLGISIIFGGSHGARTRSSKIAK